MPGLIGAVARQPDAGLSRLFDQLIAPMRRGTRFQVETHVSPADRWALGRVHLGVLCPAAQLAAGKALQVLFHGDLHNAQELRQSLRNDGRPGDTSSATGLIAALYTQHGSDLAPRLKGAFCAAIVDETAGKLVLISDFLGSYPLYWVQGPKRLIFASELKSVLRDPDITRTLDPRAVADYIQFGFVFGDRTLAESVRLLPSASTLSYCWNDGTCEIRRYRRLADLFLPPDQEVPQERLNRLKSTFTQAVRRTRSGDHAVGLSLSGGLDTRAILSALPQGSPPVSTYTLGVRGCADEVIAEKLSRAANTRHRFFELDDRYLAAFVPNLAEMVSLTDGMYLSHGLTEILALRFLGDVDFNVLLRGHCGELAKTSLAWPFHTDAHIDSLRSKDELISYLLTRLSYVVHGTALTDLFTPDWSERMKDGPRQSMAESLRDVPLSPPDLCSYLYLEEHHRRFTVPSLEMFRNVVEIGQPFADEDFLADLFGTSQGLRRGTEIHRALLRKELAKVRNSNTGAAADAGPVVEALLDKFNSLFKKLNVYGYRHYHNFDAWMKAQLLESVESILLDSTTLSRGMLRKASLLRLISETKSGAADHGYLFQVLLILELWQRENLT